MTIVFNNDLLTEIFIWLPPKSLIRFKRVSKQWFSLISSHHFSHRHSLNRHRRSKPEPSLLVCLSESSNYFYLQLNKYGQKLVPYNFPPSLIEALIEPNIVSASNGLLLLQSRNVENLPKECHIYNPTTKQFRRIVLNVNDRYKFVMGLNLAYDPVKSPYYKIVCVRTTRRRRMSGFMRSPLCFCMIEMYDSETSGWSVCGEPFWAPLDVDFSRGIYWKCGIHWDEMFFDPHDNLIYKHPEIEIPGDNRTERWNVSYVESYGDLHYIANFPKKNSVTVFKLRSDCSEWLLKYRIDFDRVCGPLSVMSFVSGESDEDGVLVIHEPGGIMGYEFREKDSKELVDFREEAFYEEGCVQFVDNCSFHFIGTLVPV